MTQYSMRRCHSPSTHCALSLRRFSRARPRKKNNRDKNLSASRSAHQPDSTRAFFKFWGKDVLAFQAVFPLHTVHSVSSLFSGLSSVASEKVAERQVYPLIGGSMMKPRKTKL